MSGPDDIVREALASLLTEHPRAMVTDPGQVRALLEAKLGPDHPVKSDLIDALVLATHPRCCATSPTTTGPTPPKHSSTMRSASSAWVGRRPPSPPPGGPKRSSP